MFGFHLQPIMIQSGALKKTLIQTCLAPDFKQGWFLQNKLKADFLDPITFYKNLSEIKIY